MSKEGKILEASIKHWTKMIRWVKRQDPNEVVNYEKMLQHIHEEWSGTYCSLCHYYVSSCYDCILVTHTGMSCSSVGSLWCKVDCARTWGGWLKCAKSMLATLIACRKHVKV